MQFYVQTPWIRVLMTWIRQDERVNELRREDHRFQMQMLMIMVMMKPRVIAPLRSVSRLSPSLKVAKRQVREFTVSLMDKQYMIWRNYVEQQGIETPFPIFFV
jgi:hypothetical protein